MRLAINHISRYDYDQPVHYSVLRLRLRPQSSAVQVVQDWRVRLLELESQTLDPRQATLLRDALASLAAR